MAKQKNPDEFKPKTVPCKGCGKPIVYAKVYNERRRETVTVPLDPRPRTYKVYYPEGGGDILEGVMKPRRFMVTHFATCPNAGDFSQGKKGGGRHDKPGPGAHHS